MVAAAAHRAAEPAYVPGSARAADIDLRLNELAVTVALRRHARPHIVPLAPGEDGGVRRGGKDLRNVRLVVGSGGVLRPAAPDRAVDVVRRAVHDHDGGWKSPDNPRVVIDRSYVLAAAGLLSFEHKEAALGLLKTLNRP